MGAVAELRRLRAPTIGRMKPQPGSWAMARPALVLGGRAIGQHGNSDRVTHLDLQPRNGISSSLLLKWKFDTSGNASRI